MTFKQVLHQLNRRDTKFLPKNLTITKLVLILFISFTVFFFTKTILAASNTPKTFDEQYTDKEKGFKSGSATQENWQQEYFTGLNMVGIHALVGGSMPTTKTTTTRTAWVPGGLIGATNKAIGMVYNIPISGVQYLAYVKDSFLGKPTYAATGFQSMSPLIPIWKGFRNTTYVLFSIIFVVMGLMIMLRVKISPQATVTIQSAIPKIITSLVLVTFSYAIVGLLIDFSYLITNLGVSIIYQATGDTSAISNTGLDFWNRVWSIANPFNGFTIVSGLVTMLTNGIGAVGSVVFGIVLGFVGGVLGIFIILLMVFINVIRFFFALLKCYINILLKTIIGPLEIALGAIPNMKMGFGTWFTDILANIMVFPITTIVLVIIKKIMDVVWNSPTMWLPPGLEQNSLGNTNQFISLTIGFTGLMLIAKLPAMIPEFIFQIKPSPFGKAIGESFAPLGKLAGGTAKATAVGKGNDWDTRSATPGATTIDKAKGLAGRTVKQLWGK